MFEKGVKVVFSVEGPGIIHISGRYLFDGEWFFFFPSFLFASINELNGLLYLIGEYGDMDMGGVPQEIDMESSSSSSQPIEMDAEQYEEEDSSSSSSSIPEKKRPAPQEVEESESSEPKPKAVFKGKQQQAEEDSSSEVKEVKKRRRAKGDESDLEVQHMSIRGEDLQFIDLCKGGGKVCERFFLWALLWIWRFFQQSVRKGNKIRVRYTGRFANSNKIFDTSGRKCFSFTAGKGEVIQGFDAGMKGMMPGGKRKIFIPSELAYGAEGAPPDIPAHSDLIFEVEMVGFGSGTGKKKARNQKRQSSPPRLGY